jgi:hypothetical protein
MASEEYIVNLKSKRLRSLNNEAILSVSALPISPKGIQARGAYRARCQHIIVSALDRGRRCAVSSSRGLPKEGEDRFTALPSIH